MSYKCIIFDDEPSSIVEVSFLLGKYAPNWKIMGVASDVPTFQKLLKEQSPDIIFSDIHIGKSVVFDVLPELRQFKGDIVFVSGDNGFASQAFELSAVNYFLKPIKDSKFASFVSTYRPYYHLDGNDLREDVFFHNLTDNSTTSKRIAFHISTGYVVKELADIVYAKAVSNYSEFYFLNGEKLLTTKTLMSFENTLERYGFLRVHQTYLVNLKCVSSFNNEDCELLLTSGEVLPVSSRKRSNLLETLRRVF